MVSPRDRAAGLLAEPLPSSSRAAAEMSFRLPVYDGRQRNG